MTNKLAGIQRGINIADFESKQISIEKCLQTDLPETLFQILKFKSAFQIDDNLTTRICQES